MSEARLDFSALEQSLTDVIQEQQIKIGYRKEKVRLFYPASSVNNLLGLRLEPLSIIEALKGFDEYVSERLGEIQCSCDNDRFCFVIPEKGVEYIHDKIEDRCFLKDFVQTISRHGCSLEDIKSVFQSYSDKYTFEKAVHGEFDYLMFFNNGMPDKYLYCIKFEDEHAIYHRFTSKDYEDFQF